MDSLDFSFLQDALASGDMVLIVAAALALVTVAVLKLTGKKVPILDTVLPLALKALTSYRKKDAAAQVPEPPAPEAPVVNIADIKVLSESFGKVSPETLAKFEADMVASGYVKQADGSWKLTPGGDK